MFYTLLNDYTFVQIHLQHLQRWCSDAQNRKPVAVLVLSSAAETIFASVGECKQSGNAGTVTRNFLAATKGCANLTHSGISTVQDTVASYLLVVTQYIMQHIDNTHFLTAYDSCTQPCKLNSCQIFSWQYLDRTFCNNSGTAELLGSVFR